MSNQSISDGAVHCINVVKEFGQGDSKVQALRGVDLDVPYGGISMIVGPSGCGKTTLLSIIAGLLESSSGHFSVLGQDPSKLSENGRVLFRRRNLGFVFQQYNLLPALTSIENVAVPLLAAGVNRNEAFDRAATLLDQLGMKARGNALPNTLSGGQQQRVAFARALVHEPRLVVCDEPTAALDAETGYRVMELLSQIAVRPDRAVIVVTHDNRIFEFADLIVHLEDGRVVETHHQTSVRNRDASARRAAAA